MLCFYLEENISDNYQERPEEVEEEPLLNGFDIKGDREVLWNRDVDRGQQHHAGDVNAVDQAALVLLADVVVGLVDDIHQDGGEAGHREYLGHFGFSDGVLTNFSCFKF